MVFEALHNLEPRGYVVGWIIAISLLVGILIFLLLAVLLWKVSLGTTNAGSFPTQDTRSQASPGTLEDDSLHSTQAKAVRSPWQSVGRWNLASSQTTLEREKGPQSPSLIYPQRIKPILTQLLPPLRAPMR